MTEFWDFCHVQSSLCVQVLSSLILTASLHRTSAADVSQTLRCGTRNGIRELSERAPPVFAWAAITFGIGPHSSFLVLSIRYSQDATTDINAKYVKRHGSAQGCVVSGSQNQKI